MAKRRSSTIPQYKRRRKGSFLGRLIGWIVKIILAFLIISVLWVLAYRFVNPPVTFNMIGDLIAGRGVHKSWMPIGEIDRDVVQYALERATVRFERYPRMDALVEVEGPPGDIERAIRALGMPRAAFTADRLVAFVARFEARTGERAALNRRQIAGDASGEATDG